MKSSSTVVALLLLAYQTNLTVYRWFVCLEVYVPVDRNLRLVCSDD